jgi:hypothetical protein
MGTGLCAVHNLNLKRKEVFEERAARLDPTLFITV